MTQGNKIKVAIIGVGNCASSLVQGVFKYRDAPVDELIPGLMHPVMGKYHIGDIEAFSFERLDSGVVFFKKILEHDSDSKFYPKALFTLCLI